MSGSMRPGGNLRRFAAITPAGARINLAPDHPALTGGHTIFPSRVFATGTRPRLLISGHNSRKIGKVVTKGRWRGFPIFTLTLEERATCPRSCEQWKTCYGNNMHHAVRHAHGPAFEAALWGELADKQAEHPDGFVVRLHILGDFYSIDYAELWAEAMEAYPALRIFGYTAHPPPVADRRGDRPAARRASRALRHPLQRARCTGGRQRRRRSRRGDRASGLPRPAPRRGRQAPHRLLRDLHPVLADRPHHRLPATLKGRT